MRKFLIGILVLAALILGALFWLAQYAENNPPQTGEQRMEIDIDV